MADARKSRRDGPPPRRTRKSFFVRGLIVLLPTVLTIGILVAVLQFIGTYLTSPVNRTIYKLLDGNGFGWELLELMRVDPYDREFLAWELLPLELQDELTALGWPASPAARARLADWRAGRESFLRDLDDLAIDRAKLLAATQARVPPIFGVLISAAIVLTLGYLASGFLGRRLIASFDRTLSSIPVVRSVYPYTKQVVDFFLADEKLEFETVVAAPYPSEKIWAVGFVTGKGMASLNERLGGEYVSVFVPTSPMPMTGYTIFVEARRLLPLDITVDEALRMIVSAGVLVPASEEVGDVKRHVEELARAGAGGDAEA